MTPSLNLVIVGGGPAGCATAIALSKAMAPASPALNLHLVDSARQPEAPAVGETIPPAATPVLRDLALLELLESRDHLECPGSIALWGSAQPGYNDFFFSPVGKGYHLDRAKFDADLRRAAGARGLKVASGWRLRRIEARQSGYRLGFSVPPEPAVTRWLDADFVVDATGLGAALSRRLGVAWNRFDEVICLCAFYVTGSDPGVPAHTLVQAQPRGWWYAARLPGQRAIVSLCTDRETLRQAGFAEPSRWHRAFLEAEWLAGECRRQFGAVPGIPDRVHMKPAPSAILSAVVGERWLAVGDAASSYDSMSSAGITKALMQGEIAGKALARWALSADRVALTAYQDRVFADFSQYLRLHQLHYRGEPRFPGSGFWQRRRLSL